MPNTLQTCPVCHIPNFSVRGLKAHRCKGPKEDPGALNVPKGETSCLPSGEIQSSEKFAECEVIAGPPAKRGGLDPARHQLAVLNDAIGEINAFHRAATSAADAAKAKAAEASHYAILVGIRLEQIQGSTAHGEWGKLFSGRKNPRLTSNSAQIGECAEFEFSQDTASRYMEVAKRIRLERKLSGKAIKNLELIASAPEIDEAARTTLNKLTQGQTLRQLYLDLDIITAPPAKAKTEPAKPAAKGPVKSEAQLRIEDARESVWVWQEAWHKFVKRGQLDDLPQEETRALHEFLATCRDQVKTRIQSAKS